MPSNWINYKEHDEVGNRTYCCDLEINQTILIHDFNTFEITTMFIMLKMLLGQVQRTEKNTLFRMESQSIAKVLSTIEFFSNLPLLNSPVIA